MSPRARFLDGCHRYGWLITIMVNLALFAYFTGGLRADVTNLKESMNEAKSRIVQLERNWYDYLTKH